MSATSPRCNFISSVKNIRSTKRISAIARLINALFPGILFFISTTVGSPELTGSCDPDPGVPESTKTGASTARWPAIAAMMAAVVL